jgi:hypothetical protein
MEESMTSNPDALLPSAKEVGPVVVAHVALGGPAIEGSPLSLPLDGVQMLFWPVAWQPSRPSSYAHLDVRGSPAVVSAAPKTAD